MTADVATARSIFLIAVERYGVGEWSAYLDSVCGDKAELRDEVERLLAAHQELGTFHDHAANHVASTLPAATGFDAPGERIGPYTIREQLGEGGMGVVYEAVDTLRKTPSIGRETAQRLAEGGPVELKDEAILLVHKVDLRKRRDAAAERAQDPKASEEARDIARREYDDAVQQIDEVDMATAATKGEAKPSMAMGTAKTL